ncbi:MAG: guanylate kinase [Rhizobacter sp.]|nr:guanylate kinase [Chlorobiales bacterium]
MAAAAAAKAAGKLIVFAAPSGTGKSTIAKRLLAATSNLVFSVSATTRPKRTGETDGVDYFFLSEDEFREHVANGDFLEHEEVYAGRFYGTLKEKIDAALQAGKNLLLDLDVKGAMSIKQHYGERAYLIFIKPPSLEALRERLSARRSETEEMLTKRLERAKFEMSFAEKFDCTITNDDLEKAVEDVREKVNSFIY